MKINAYFIIGDPSFIEVSLLSIYDLVERIVISFDHNYIGYTGVKLDTEECIRRLKLVDTEGKCDYEPGVYAGVKEIPMEGETYQRQCAFESASQDADWVIQIDTDEVVGDLSVFERCIGAADKAGYMALNYPARWLYQYLGDGRYLENSRKDWGPVANYPGSNVIKAGATLVHARLAEEPCYHVDYRKRSTDPYKPKDWVVHEVIDPKEGVQHFARVRSPELMRAKSEFSPHRDQWNKHLNRWEWCKKHPYLAVARTPLMRKRAHGRLRFGKVDDPTGLIGIELKKMYGID